MKKIFLITLVVAVAVMLSACGRQKYTTWTPTTATAPQATEAVDPITNFNTVWTSENTPSATAFSDSQKRTLSNFFGFNDAYKASLTCPFGFKDINTNLCFVYSDFPPYFYTDILRTYFESSESYIRPYPSPKNFGTVTSYKIRFAVNVNQATGNITPGDAYLDIDLNSSSDTFNVKFSAVKVPLTVSSTGDVAVTLEDECGDLTFTAKVIYSGTVITAVQNGKITFLNTPASYKKASCYHDGKVPTIITNSIITYPSTAPVGIDVESGRGLLFKSGCSSILISDFHKEQ